MSSNQPVEAPAEVIAPRRLLEEQEPAPAPASAPDQQPAAQQELAPQVAAPIATVVPPPPLVVGVPTNPRTGEPRRPVVIVVSTVLCWLAVALTGASLLWVYWDAVSNFAKASWLMGQFVTEPGSLERVLLAVAVTAIGIIIGVANAIVGWYALTGYRWTRIAGIISAVLTAGALVLNQLGWYAIPAAVIGAGMLWLPQAKAFFTAWHARRHPEQVFAPPTVDVLYGPLPRYRKA
jgi:hypothetical protein